MQAGEGIQPRGSATWERHVGEVTLMGPPGGLATPGREGA